MRQQVIRGLFSALAGAVFAATSAEHLLWFGKHGGYWRLVIVAFLSGMATFESMQVWRRVDRLIEEVA